MQEILYLNAQHLGALDLDKSQIVGILEEIFRHKASGNTRMPPKVFFHHAGDRFYSAMSACATSLGYAGCKWQSGDPGNPLRGLPYIQGLYILTDNGTGEMLAVMDARWITGQRTAAASALVARYQAREDAKELAILGCGLQGRAHLEILAAEIPSLTQCRVYDILPEAQNDFVMQLDGCHNGVSVTGVQSAEEAVRGADVVITGGPIQEQRDATIVSDWIRPGALVVTIDYDSYVTDDCIAAMDIVLTDDFDQIEDARNNEDKFTGISRVDADLAQMITTGKGLRQSDDQRIMAFNLGIALEDLATAAEILKRARQKGIGVSLSP